MKLPSIKFRTIVAALIAILIASIVLLTCRNRKELQTVLHPTKVEVDQANESKKQHDLFVDSIDKKNKQLQRDKDSLAGIVRKKDVEIQVKSQRIAALTRKAVSAKTDTDELLFVQTCDSLIPQVDDLLSAVDQLQQDNRNVQDAYDSLLGSTSLKSARQEYDYDELQQRFSRFKSLTDDALTRAMKSEKKAGRRLVIGPQGGVTYDFISGRLIPYIGAGATWKLFAF